MSFASIFSSALGGTTASGASATSSAPSTASSSSSSSTSSSAAGSTSTASASAGGAYTLSSNLTLYSPECPWGLTGAGCQSASCNTTFTGYGERVARASNSRQCSSCPDGFGGSINCNVCQASNSCQLAQQAQGFQAPQSSSAASSAGSLVPAANQTAVCVNTPRAITATAIQCDMNQTTLASIFGGSFQLTAIKTAYMGEGNNTNDLSDGFNSVGLAPYNAPGGTYTSQIWLDGVLQWGCQASNCSSFNSTDPADRPTGSASTSVTDMWRCSNLKCHCVPGSTVCGGGAFDLSGTIEALDGDNTFACSYPKDQAEALRGNMNCRFTGPSFASALGAEGLPLVNCAAGACVTQADLQNFWANDSGETVGASASKLSGGVIAGLAVLGAFVLALLLAVLAGLLLRARARKAPREPPTPAVGLRWDAIDYVVGGGGAAGALLARRKHKKSSAEQNGAADDAEKHANGNANGAASLSSGSSDNNGKVAAANGNGAADNLSGRTAENQRRALLSVPVGGVDGNALTAYEKGQGKAHLDGRILRDVSGEVVPGSMLAILGPSGAGKTSLVDILAGRAKAGHVSGTVSLVGGATFQGAQQQRKVAFVDQEDVLPAFSTVREALEMAAQLSLPENVPKDERHEIVNTVLLQLGLEHIANKRIGDQYRRGVSGGEKRRISIGIALVGRPKILIMDEPLSGLDSVNAQRVVSALRSMASGPDNGTTIIMTVHQPSSFIFESFDKVMLMSQGRVLFHGPPSESAAWCESRNDPVPRNHNPADHLLQIAFSDVASNSLPSETPASSTPTKGRFTRSAFSSPFYDVKPVATLFTQVGLLSRRAFLNAWRDRAGAIAHIFGITAVGLITGGAFYHVNESIAGFQNRVGSIFFLLLLITFAGLSAMTLLNRARPLMARERGNGLYNPFSWLLSHVIYDLLLLRLIPSIILINVIYWMVGLKAEAGVFWQFFLSAILYNFAITLYFMALAAFFEDMSIPTLLGGLAILFSLAFAGFLLNSNSIPPVLRWIRWICPMKYALESMAIIQLPGLRIIDTVNGVPINAAVSVIAPNLFGFQGSDGGNGPSIGDIYYRDVLILALAFVLGFFCVLTGAVFWRMRELR